MVIGFNMPLLYHIRRRAERAVISRFLTYERYESLKMPGAVFSPASPRSGKHGDLLTSLMTSPFGLNSIRKSFVGDRQTELKPIAHSLD